MSKSRNGVIGMANRRVCPVWSHFRGILRVL